MWPFYFKMPSNESPSVALATFQMLYGHTRLIISEVSEIAINASLTPAPLFSLAEINIHS